jgi:DNA N-6-adenine-methyltransferase (Dam)/ParB-like nuclease domain
LNYFDPRNWHEAANLFPLLPLEDLRELAEDIRQNGLLNPIVLLDSKVLDGRNRLLACKKAGVKPSFSEFVQNGVPPAAWVISLNLKRRHLSSGQRAAVAVEAKPLLETATRQHSLANLKRGIARGLKIDTSETTGRVEKQVAKQFEVSQGYVYAASKIREADEQIFQKLKAGTLSIPEAQRAVGHKVSTQAMVSADSNEWYTPENYVKAVKQVLGQIDLDPATCELANKKCIKATTIHTIEDDGLKHKWTGRVFLNPPYGDAASKFAAKVLHEYQAKRVAEAIVLLNSHVTDAKWFKPLFDYVMCFTDHRSRFWNQDGIGGSPTHGSVFVYLGKNTNKFATVFKHLGSVVHKVVV